MADDELQKYVELVLNGLSDGGLHSIAEILFGFNMPPDPGSDDDYLVKNLEEHLLQHGYVIEREPRNGNNLNGYGRYIISTNGTRHLKQLKGPRQESQEKSQTTASENSHQEPIYDKPLDDLARKIQEEKLPGDLFFFKAVEGSGLLITIKDAINNEVYFQFQPDKAGYEVRQAVGEDDTNSVYVKTWSNVLTWFEAWLEKVRHLPIFVTEFVKSISQAKYLIKQEGPSDFEFQNENVRAALGVEEQARIFLKLIQSISKTEGGALLGIFGRWGRGKTYFWGKLKKCFELDLKENKLVEYIPIDFHAWKYQDTPASWAYLYESFAERFYKEPRSFYYWGQRWYFSGWFLRLINRVRVNWQRIRKFETIWLITTLSVLTFSIALIILGPVGQEKFLGKIAGVIGVAALTGITYFLVHHSGRAKDLIKKVLTKHTFSNFLGVQAEIQKEFVMLLKTWIPDRDEADKKIKNEIADANTPHKALPNKRVILFVEDIDRCNEERIIEIIDALKVMLDDKDIAERVTVIAAIDEIVLKRAINLKYYRMIEHDLSVAPDKRKPVQDLLCREYMDKLFLNGFRLGGLRRQDKVEILRAMTEDRTFFRNDDKKESFFSEPFRDAPESAMNESDVGGRGVPDINKALNELRGETPDDQAKGVKDIKDALSLLHNPKYELMDYELGRLISALTNVREATPRSIRIFYYRYQLAKYFTALMVKEGSQLYTEWQLRSDAERAILPHLIVEYSTEKDHRQLSDTIDLLVGRPGGTITVQTMGVKFHLSKRLYCVLLKIVEIVVPY